MGEERTILAHTILDFWALKNSDTLLLDDGLFFAIKYYSSKNEVIKDDIFHALSWKESNGRSLIKYLKSTLIVPGKAFYCKNCNSYNNLFA
jgi:hypothetical protein